MKVHEAKGLLHPKKGKYGVEIEMESNLFNFSEYVPPNSWRLDSDGSLKSIFNIEYVLQKPFSYPRVVAELQCLQDFLDTKEAQINSSMRAGVHIHLNVTDKTFEELTKIVLVYLTLERVLSQYCGEDRSGNLFCLRACDCPAYAVKIKDAIERDDWFQFSPDLFKYASLNLSSILNHGSLEFRMLKTPQKVTDIVEWIDIIEAIEKYALGLDDYKSIPYDLSYRGPDMWVKEVLGAKLAKAVEYPGYEKDLHRGMRDIQMLYYTKPKGFKGKTVFSLDIDSAAQLVINEEHFL